MPCMCHPVHNAMKAPRHASMQRHARIGDNVVIVNKDRVEEADKPELGFYIRNGIVVVVKNATIANGTII